jgi:hypothetical protein
MLATPLTFLAFAVAGLAQSIPAGYSKVYITSAVDTKYAIVPKSAANGSTIVVCVPPSSFPSRLRLILYSPTQPKCKTYYCPALTRSSTYSIGRRLTINQNSSGISRAVTLRSNWQTPLCV